MYVDSNLEFSDAQVVTTTAISTNVFDLFTVDVPGSPNITPNQFFDVGVGTGGLYLIVQTEVAAASAGSTATVVITLESADDAGLTTNNIIEFSTGVLAAAAYQSAGTRLVTVRLPINNYRRYLGVRYTIASGPLTAGAFSAFLTTEATISPVYKSGFVVQ